MYADGVMDETSAVMIDIGTGYYVEKVRPYNQFTKPIKYCVHSFFKSVPEAAKYFERKIQYLTKKMEELQGPLQEKFRMKNGNEYL
jgi:prefoldin alpha subunit